MARLYIVEANLSRPYLEGSMYVYVTFLEGNSHTYHPILPSGKRTPLGKKKHMFLIVESSCLSSISMGHGFHSYVK